MNTSRRVAALLIAGAAIAGLPARTQAAASAAGSPCGLPVAVIGADVTPANLPPLRRALGVAPGTTELRETLANERTQAHGLIPPALLGIVAVSSVLLSPRPQGAGLDVTVMNDVTLDAATTYANALLTAGVTDATVRVDAPPSQQALGTTALLGLLRAAETLCAAISPARRDLAIREIALTDSLARYVGPRGAAARLLFALKRDAVAGGLVAPAALETLIVRDATARGAAVPPALQPVLTAYLRDLVASRAYAAIAAARPSVGGPLPLRAIVRLSGTGADVSSAAGTARGTVTAAGGARLVVRQFDGTRTYQPSSAVPVYRDGRPSNLGAIRPGDTVTITTNAAGQPTRIDAVSVGTTAVVPTDTARGAIVRGVAVVGGAATGLAVRRANGSFHIYHPAPAVPVYRDGQPSSLGAIRRDDAVTVTTNAAGDATRIDATSTGATTGAGAIVHGVAAAAVTTAGGLIVHAATGTRTYHPSPATPVYRNGVRSSLGAIRPSDAVTVTTNAAGGVTRIDASSALVAPLAGVVAPKARQGGFNPAWLWLLLPAALLLGGLLLLGLLRRRGAAVVPEPAPIVAATEGDIRVPVYEEELTVGTRPTQIGDVHLHKEVVTEQRSVPVTLRHEEVTVERMPFTGAMDPDATQHAFQGQDVDMAVMDEQAVAGKTVREVEEVRLRKDTRRERRRVTDTVRKERATVDEVDTTRG